MAKLNMVNMNTLFKKVYLLAGMMMAANIFAMNEVKATNETAAPLLTNILKTDDVQQQIKNQMLNNINNIPTEENQEKKQENLDVTGAQSARSFFGFLSSWENVINLIGGAVSSVANNYFKLWNYDAGGYFKLGCFGWRSKRFLNGMFQFDINLNLGRGVLWLIPGAYNFINFIKLLHIKVKDSYGYIKCLHVSYLVASNLFKGDSMQITAIIVFFLLQGFVSMPLTVHISNFSISISLDSIIWAGVGKLLEAKIKKEEKKE